MRLPPVWRIAASQSRAGRTPVLEGQRDKKSVAWALGAPALVVAWAGVASPQLQYDSFSGATAVMQLTLLPAETSFGQQFPPRGHTKRSDWGD